MGIKRSIWLILALSIFLTLPLQVTAAEETDTEALVTEGFLYGQTVDLTGHGLTPLGLKRLVDQLRFQGQLPWYAFGEYSYEFDETSGKVLSLTGTVVAGIPEDADTLYRQALAQILDECVFEGMSQWQIALSLHDYLAVHAQYDQSLTKRSAYHLVVEGISVCAGYAKAYQDLLLMCGIDCRYVTSEPMNHGWNQVNIDGNWYHVDVTWDDPSPDVPGRVSHEYFLVTDEEISQGEKPHYGWDRSIECTDTGFSQGFWREVDSAITYTDSQTCYFLQSRDYCSYLYRRDSRTGDQTLLYQEAPYSVDIGAGRYQYYHYGLTLREGRLWFNAMDKVCSVNLEGKDLQTHYTAPGDRFIRCCYPGYDLLSVTLSDHDGNYTLHTQALTPTQAHACRFQLTVVPPTCATPGYTLSKCACGLEAKSMPTAPGDHDYRHVFGEKPGLFRDGYALYRCNDCDDSYEEYLSGTDLADLWQNHRGKIVAGFCVLLFVIRTVTLKKKE